MKEAFYCAHPYIGIKQERKIPVLILDYETLFHMMKQNVCRKIESELSNFCVNVLFTKWEKIAISNYDGM